MERMLVVVFDNEKKAFEGRTALRQLDVEGSITIYAGAVITKHADGTVSVKQYDDFGPLGTIAGTAIGSLIGLLGGPAGLVVGGLSGLTAGALYDLDNALVGSDFVDDVMQSLSPNKVAIVAEVEEEWTTPVDARMEAAGGTVFRRSLLEVRIAARDEEIAVMKNDLAKLKEEMRTADASRKAKLHEKVEQLQAKIDAVQAKAKDRRAQFEARAKSKLEILKKNAAAAGRAIKELGKTPL